MPTNPQEDEEPVNIWQVPFGDLVEFKDGTYRVSAVTTSFMPTVGKMNNLVLKQGNKRKKFYRGIQVYKVSGQLWKPFNDAKEL